MRRLLILLIALASLAGGWPAVAQTTPQPTPEQLAELASLLRDPAIQAWLESQAEGRSLAPEPQPAPRGMRELALERLNATRNFLRELAEAAPRLPDQLGQVGRVLSLEFEEHGLFSVLVLLVVFAALGSGLEGLFWWATTRFRQRMMTTGLDTVRSRLQSVGLRLVYGISVLLAFAIGSVGAFLLFDWPTLLREIVLAYLIVFLIVRLVLVLGRIILAPGAERFRVVPMSSRAARFWFVWSAILIGWFFFVQASLDLLGTLGLERGTGYLIGLSCGIVLLGLALYVVWRHPGHDEAPATAQSSSRIGRLLLSIYLVVVWLLLFTGSVKPFYVGVLLLLLPIAIRGSDLAVNHLLRPPGHATSDESVPSVAAAALERGLRAALLIGGAYLLADVMDLDLGTLTSSDTLATRLARGAINAAVILLLADFAWYVLRAWIDTRLRDVGSAQGLSADEERRRARLRTLLPIMRNLLLILLITMAGLMALSALGVQVAPLVAGAGVVGVAIGFGAQTLVKDIISGMFFLLDDAFRVGEYIESGSIRGTVEAFSLRSIKLRHHRGALHTVPFGSLDKITNYSRDWVIDKMTISVTYDTDLDKVKKIIKQIGKELQADPEFAPNLIETLKMQGVEQFGDFAIEIRMKMMTKPGEQFVIRRKAYAMIKKAFAANGIQFAFPTVTVAGGDGEAAAAIAQRGLELAAPQPAAT
jgi:small-conductance mechanosensitive channel